MSRGKAFHVPLALREDSNENENSPVSFSSPFCRIMLHKGRYACSIRLVVEYQTR